MMKKRNWLTVCAAAVLSLGISVQVAQAQTGGGYDLTWNTMDGGAIHGVGGSYSLDGSIGQPDAAILSGGSFTIYGGFWGAFIQYRAYVPIVRR